MATLQNTFNLVDNQSYAISDKYSSPVRETKNKSPRRHFNSFNGDAAPRTMPKGKKFCELKNSSNAQTNKISAKRALFTGAAINPIYDPSKGYRPEKSKSDKNSSSMQFNNTSSIWIDIYSLSAIFPKSDKRLSTKDLEKKMQKAKKHLSHCEQSTSHRRKTSRRKKIRAHNLKNDQINATRDKIALLQGAIDAIHARKLDKPIEIGKVKINFLIS